MRYIQSDVGLLVKLLPPPAKLPGSIGLQTQGVGQALFPPLVGDLNIGHQNDGGMLVYPITDPGGIQKSRSDVNHQIPRGVVLCFGLDRLPSEVQEPLISYLSPKIIDSLRLTDESVQTCMFGG